MTSSVGATTEYDQWPGTLDPTESEFFARPDYFKVLEHLRLQSPRYLEGPGLWVVSTYDQIKEISRDPARFCSSKGALVNDPLRGGAAGTPSILHMDPPQHGDFRGLINRRFTPRYMASLEDQVREWAKRVIERARNDAEIDFVEEISAPFPLLVICELLGIAEGDRSDFRRWSDATIESPDVAAGETAKAFGELAGFLLAHIDAKRNDPGEDLVSLLLSSEVGGEELSNDELFMFLLTLLVAGNETTRSLLSGAVLALFEHPDQRASLVHDHRLIPGAVEECLRWVTPIQAFCRTATGDTEVGDVPIKEGDYLVMLYASGNRDRAAFGNDADRFDIARSTQPLHVAFGFGEHVCLGASLARMEARVFLEEFLGRYPNYRVTGEASRTASTTVAGIASLPVRLDP